MRRLLLLACFSLAAASGVAQLAVLTQDPSPDNRCMKAHQGAMWVLRNPQNTPNILRNSDPYKPMMVTVLRIVSDGTRPRYETYMLTPGQSVELGCSQGDPPVSYMLQEPTAGKR